MLDAAISEEAIPRLCPLALNVKRMEDSKPDWGVLTLTYHNSLPNVSEYIYIYIYIEYIYKPKCNNLGTTLRPKGVPCCYMDPLGYRGVPFRNPWQMRLLSPVP